MKTPIFYLLAAAAAVLAVSACKNHADTVRHDKNYDPKFHNHYYHQPHHHLRGD